MNFMSSNSVEPWILRGNHFCSSLLLRDHLGRVIVPSKPFRAYPATFNVLLTDVVACKLLLPAQVLPLYPIVLSSLV